MGDKRPTDSELRLGKLDDEGAQREPRRGILELFRRPKPKPHVDAPLQRDEDATASPDSPS
jgi:hypothetical protein